LKISTRTVPAKSPGEKAKVKVDVKLGGKQDADMGWIQDVQTMGADHVNRRRVGVLPRFIVEVTNADLFVKLAAKEALQNLVIKTIQNEIVRVGADGMVLEMSDAWSLVTSQAPPKVRNGLNEFLLRLAAVLHATPAGRKQIALVVRPMREKSSDFQNFDFEQVKGAVDFFSLMVRFSLELMLRSSTAEVMDTFQLTDLLASRRTLL
jgi:hypothetical protein